MATSTTQLKPKPSSGAKSYKLRVDKNRIKEELTVMVLDSDGSSQLYSMTRPEILEVSKEFARKLRHSPFGEMKMKDLRMLDPNVSFGAEPKIIVRTLCALVSINPIHAFVLPNRILMIVPDGADGILQSIKNHLKVIIQASMEMDLSEEGQSMKEEDDIASQHGDYDAGYGMAYRGKSSSNLDISSNGHTATAGRDDENNNEEEEGEEELNNNNNNNGNNGNHQTSSIDKRDTDDSIPEVAEAKPILASPVTSPVRSPVRRRSSFSNKGSPNNGIISSPPNRKRQQSFGSHVGRHHHLPPARSLLRTRSYSSQDETPFQFVAMELIFDTAALSFKKEVDLLKLARDQVTNMLEANELFTKINALRSKIVATREVVEDFMSDDKDLGMLSFDSIMEHYISHSDDESEHGVDEWQPFEVDVNEVEDLAEDFVSRMDDAVNEIDMLRFALEEIHSNLKHLADLRRERLMKCHIRIQGITCLAAAPTLVAGLFGMNLYSGLESESDTANFWVTFWILLGGFLLGTVAFVYLSNKFFNETDLRLD